MQPERNGRVAGIVLAAGTSSRMGFNKMLLRLNGESLLQRPVKRASAAGLAPVVVVLGHEADRARGELANLPCQPILNADYARGINVSLQTGLAAVPEDAAAAVGIFAGMPFRTAPMIASPVRR